MPPLLEQKITRRLLPLYVAAFLQSFVFWYAVEKLFMGTIGFNNATIGLMAAAYSVMMLFIATPSGMLADRWSRKGVLIIASLALALSSFICGLSHSVPVFIAGAVIWGVFFALYTGTYDSIVYDVLLEEAGHSSQYERFYGRIRIIESAALIAGSLIGGLIAAKLGLRATYLITIPFVAVSIGALAYFKEPKLHKAIAAETIGRHLNLTLQAIRQSGAIAEIFVILVIGSTISALIMEFSQLWLIAAHTSIGLYGAANAIVLSTIGLSGFLAAKLNLKNPLLVALFATTMLISGATTIASHTTWPLIISLSLLCICLLSLGIIYLKQLHDRLPSRFRSGASSAVSTLERAVFIIIALAFGWLSQVISVSAASWLIFIPLVGICGYLIVSARSTAQPPIQHQK